MLSFLVLAATLSAQTQTAITKLIDCESNLFTATIPYQYSYAVVFDQDPIETQLMAQNEMSSIIQQMMMVTSENCTISNYTEIHTFDNTSHADICAECNLTEETLTSNLIAVTDEEKVIQQFLPQALKGH